MMTGDERNFAEKIAGYLDRGAAELKPGAAYRLRIARQEALARLEDPQRAVALRGAYSFAGGGAGTGTAGGRRSFWTSGKLWLGILVFAVAGFGVQQWQAYRQLVEIEETDAAILSSDLPIDAYLDRGFQNWLRHVNDD
jgi:Protein of unknown function (DUF3619)